MEEISNSLFRAFGKITLKIYRRTLFLLGKRIPKQNHLGEILVKSAPTASEYRKDEEITLPSGGKINLTELESYYEKSPYFKEICIIASLSSRDKYCFLTALIFPDFNYCASQRVSQIKDRLHWEMQTLSRGLPPYKRIKKYIIIKDSLPRTALGKIKRFEITRKYSLGADSLNDSRLGQNVSAADKLLLAYPIAQQALDYLSRRLKRPVGLDEHLELDLGFDSLERIGLFFKFQELSGLELDEKQFFFVSTVREALNKLRATSGIQLQKNETICLEKILKNSPGQKMPAATRQSALSKIVNGIILVILSCGLRLFLLIKVKGKNNIPKKGPYIFCPNHSSYFDVPLLIVTMGFRALLTTYFLGYSAYLEHPLLRWSRKLFRLISVDPASHLTDTLTMCGYVLRNEKALCLFPEGIRSLDGEIHEFKRGIGILIKELHINVVPVYIRGAYEAWPPYKIFPSFGKIEVIFGKKLPPEELANKEQEREIIDIYQNIADNLKERLVDLKMNGNQR